MTWYVIPYNIRGNYLCVEFLWYRKSKRISNAKFVATLKTVLLGACSLAQGSGSDNAVFEIYFETRADTCIDFFVD